MKNNVYPLLPKLVVNVHFMREFLAAPTSCCALGVVEERSQKVGLLALHLADAIPQAIEARGMCFGHTLFGNSRYEVVYFAFEFYGFKTYNILINPNNPITRTVLSMMVESGEYFFFLLTSDQNVTAFRSDLKDGPLAGGLTTNFARVQHSTTTEAQYQSAVSAFTRHPDPPGDLLQWVCRDNPGYLDLTQDRLVLHPSR